MKTVHYGVNVKKSARVKKNIEGNPCRPLLRAKKRVILFGKKT